MAGLEQDTGTGGTTYDVVTAVSEDDGRAVFGVYDAVFGDQPDYVAWRNGVWDRHAGRDGFRLARAHDERGLAGFAYGYTGKAGQWWTDRAAEALGPDVAGAWLGGHFELVSIGVRADARGRGVGRALMERLCDGLTQDRWVLMTSAEAEDPARHLYARLRWEVLGPGLREGQVIMGRRR
ncbi:MAG: GNAT family N-acetyltransferase [Nocardioides sp.]